jgi:hypothetical protein
MAQPTKRWIIYGTVLGLAHPASEEIARELRARSAIDHWVPLPRRLDKLSELRIFDARQTQHFVNSRCLVRRAGWT